MMAEIIPLGPTQAAELADPQRKRVSTVRAKCAILNIPLKIIADDGQTIYEVGLQKFASLEAIEDWLENLANLE